MFVFPLDIVVHEANLYDSKGALQAIVKLFYSFSTSSENSGEWRYRGKLVDWARKKSGWILEVSSYLINVRPSFRHCLSDGLWNALFHDWKTSES